MNDALDETLSSVREFVLSIAKDDLGVNARGTPKSMPWMKK
ncbi:MAG: hypothetical protein WC293_04040 [Candidatus Omnitrophota bacterium]